MPDMRNAAQIINGHKIRFIYLTDADRDPNPEATMAHLPQGSAVILRDYDHPDRVQLATQLCRAARRRGLIFLVAGDARLARRVGADGLHMPQALLRARFVRGQQVISTACHDRPALIRGRRMGIALKLMSPVFDTDSGGGKVGMGLHRAHRMCFGVTGVYALGGVRRRDLARMQNIGFSGIAGITGLRRQTRRNADARR